MEVHFFQNETRGRQRHGKVNCFPEAERTLVLTPHLSAFLLSALCNELEQTRAEQKPRVPLLSDLTLPPPAPLAQHPCSRPLSGHSLHWTPLPSDSHTPYSLSPPSV